MGRGRRFWKNIRYKWRYYHAHRQRRYAELTRRMTIARNCFNRVAGAYMDEEGFIDGSFNTHFKAVSSRQRETACNRQTIPYAKTNEQLKNFRIDSRQKKPGSIWHLLTALRDCELKNDALLYSLYEYIGERYSVDKSYAIEVFVEIMMSR